MVHPSGQYFKWLVIGLCLTLSACQWRDDFRTRVQPQLERPQPAPTFNEDSDDYVGDEYVENKEDKAKEKKLDDIDELSEIPELPDKPSSLK